MDFAHQSIWPLFFYDRDRILIYGADTVTIMLVLLTVRLTYSNTFENILPVIIILLLLIIIIVVRDSLMKNIWVVIHRINSFLVVW